VIVLFGNEANQQEMGMEAISGRLIFIGLDAADSRVIARLAARGDHPAFASIVGRGVATSIVNPPGLYVGALWPTFITCSSPAAHGRYCWRQLRPGTYEDEFFQIEQIRGVPLWERVEALGCRTAVVDVPKALPSARFKGAMIKDWGTHDPSRGGFQINGWLSRTDFVRRYGEDRIGHCDSTPRTLAGFGRFRGNLIARVETRARVIVDLLADHRPDVVFCVFSEAHCAGHQCWHLHDATHVAHDPLMRARVGDPLMDVYTGLDRALGSILAQLSADDTLMVLASHGMGSHYSGVECLPELTSVIDHGLRKLPRIHGPVPHLLSRDVRAFREQLRIFPVPNNGAFAAFRLNVRGREPAGLVEPDAAGAVLDDFVAASLSLYERDSGAPIFISEVRSHDVFRGSIADQLPDLLLEWNRSYPIRTIVSPWGEVHNLDGANPRTGDHTAEGVAWTVGAHADVMQRLPIELSALGEEILKVLSKLTPFPDGSGNLDRGVRLQA
jgi:predicted AlkP superfamily phosphohydrolase/phosphomutase